MFIWAKIPDKWKDAGEIADKVLYDKNVFITPGFIFGSNGKRFIRISLGASVDKLMEAYQRIETYLSKKSR